MPQGDAKSRAQAVLKATKCICKGGNVYCPIHDWQTVGLCFNCGFNGHEGECKCSDKELLTYGEAVKKGYICSACLDKVPTGLNQKELCDDCHDRLLLKDNLCPVCGKVTDDEGCPEHKVCPFSSLLFLTLLSL